MPEGWDADPDRATVMIVDDEPAVASMYAEWLRREYTIDVAHDPVSAIEKLDEHVDVVLLDRHFPDGSGADVLRFVRDSGLDCRVAMVTGMDPGLEIVEMGFDEYICKPVREAELVRLTERLLDQAEYRDSVQEFYRLSRKISLLEATLSADTLRCHDGYRELKQRHEELDEALTDLADGISARQIQSELVNN